MKLNEVKCFSLSMEYSDVPEIKEYVDGQIKQMREDGMTEDQIEEELADNPCNPEFLLLIKECSKGEKELTVYAGISGFSDIFFVAGTTQNASEEKIVEIGKNMVTANIEQIDWSHIISQLAE